MNIGIFANMTKPALKETLGKLLCCLAGKEQTIVLSRELAGWCKTNLTNIDDRGWNISDGVEFIEHSDMIITLGGDGTMLAAARLTGAKAKPLLGINLGKLGFLAEVSTDEVEQCIHDIIQGKYLIEERLVLEARCLSDNTLMYALNDFVIDQGASSRVIELETTVNGDYLVTYSADGIILTTPTGSTAYSLASGGPIVSPASKVITINPIAPHTLSARPVIVPDTSEIKVTARSLGKDAHVTADGQVDKFYPTPAEFIIRKADYTIKLIKRKNRTYYDLLRTKLQWGRDIRTHHE